MLLAFSSVNVKADTTVRVKVDDINRVSVKVNYVPVVNLANGTNEITVPQYGALTIEAKQGYYLKSVLKTIDNDNSAPQTINNLTSCNIYVSDADNNKLFTVKSADLAAARTGSCTVKVDNASKVRVSRNNHARQ